MIRFKFKVELIKGDLEKWKNYDETIREIIKLYKGKNLKISYEENVRFVSVEYPSLKHLNNAVEKVANFFKTEGFIQRCVDGELGQRHAESQEKMSNILNEMKEVINA